MQSTETRRSFLTTLSSLGAASLIDARASFSEERPPETTTVRLAKIPGICIAPQYVADELLRAEGFTDIRYVATTPGIPAALSLAHGEVDFTANYAPTFIIRIDAGEPITIVGGVHIGCFEMLAKEGIRSIPDLKGKIVGVPAIGSSLHSFLTIMARPCWARSGKGYPLGHLAHSGGAFRRGKDRCVCWLASRSAGLARPQHRPRDLQQQHDRPWSQYFCCVLAARRNYVRDHPVATKRVIRAIIKAADLCASEPTRVAQHIVDGGFTPRYDYALQTLKELPYARWRDYNTEDTVRFYALRLREAGMIKSSPSKILSDGTDWRHWNELKRELKG